MIYTAEPNAACGASLARTGEHLEHFFHESRWRSRVGRRIISTGFKGSALSNYKRDLPCTPLMCGRLCRFKKHVSARIHNTNVMPQVETTVTVTATGPFAQRATAEGPTVQRLDAQPSVSLTVVSR